SQLLSNSYSRLYCATVLSELKMADNDNQAALDLLKSVRQYAGNQPEWLTDFARVCTARGDYASAERSLETARRVNPDGPWIALAGAEWAAKSGNGKVDDWLGKALACKHKDSCLMAACAAFLDRNGRHQEAVRLAEQALSIDPANSIAQGVVGNR